MNRKPANWRRELINKNNLTQYINTVNISERNKSIVLDYSTGLSYKEIAEKYKISTSRVEEIMQTFFFQLSKTGLYKYWEDPAYFDMMMGEILKDIQKN